MVDVVHSLILFLFVRSPSLAFRRFRALASDFFVPRPSLAQPSSLRSPHFARSWTFSSFGVDRPITHALFVHMPSLDR
jgi:hypothetical protein